MLCSCDSVPTSNKEGNMSFFDDAKHEPAAGRRTISTAPPRWIIYRINNIGAVTRVDTSNAADPAQIRQYIVDHYLYDSPDGEKYLAVDLVYGTEQIYIAQSHKSLVDGKVI
jgi:hypothetical protein